MDLEKVILVARDYESLMSSFQVVNIPQVFKVRLGSGHLCWDILWL